MMDWSSKKDEGKILRIMMKICSFVLGSPGAFFSIRRPPQRRLPVLRVQASSCQASASRRPSAPRMADFRG